MILKYIYLTICVQMLAFSERVLDRSNAEIAVDHYHRYKVLSTVPIKEKKNQQKKRGTAEGHDLLRNRVIINELKCLL